MALKMLISPKAQSCLEATWDRKNSCVAALPHAANIVRSKLVDGAASNLYCMCLIFLQEGACILGPNGSFSKQIIDMTGARQSLRWCHGGCTLLQQKCLA